MNDVASFPVGGRQGSPSVDDKGMQGRGYVDNVVPLRLLRLPDVLSRTGLSRSTVYAQEAQGKFPRHVKLGERSSAWVASEVDQWIATRIAARCVRAA